MADVKPYNNKADVMSEYCGRCFWHNIWQIILYDVAYFAHIYIICYGRC